MVGQAVVKVGPPRGPAAGLDWRGSPGRALREALHLWDHYLVMQRQDPPRPQTPPGANAGTGKPYPPEESGPSLGASRASEMPLPTAELHVLSESDPGQGTITLRGELDASSAPGLDEALSAQEAQAPPVLRVDLRRLEFMDSSGLRLLLEAHKRALAAHRRLVIVPGPPDVQAVFEVSGVHGTLEFSTD
ncbi:MAG: hypothetical protein NVSMB32_01420 [Actinomycetota bacterium]